MPLRTEVIQEMVDLAARDPDFLPRLMRDPIGTTEVEGIELNPEELRDLREEVQSLGRAMGMSSLVEELEPRISRISVPGEASHMPHLEEYGDRDAE